VAVEKIDFLFFTFMFKKCGNLILQKMAEKCEKWQQSCVNFFVNLLFLSIILNEINEIKR